MKNCFFSAIKAPLVLALPVGAVFQTRRLPKFNKKPVLAADWALLNTEFENGVLLEAWFHDGRRVAKCKPRYPVGETCYVGVPHWRLRHPDGVVAIWDEFTNVGRFDSGADEMRPESGVQFIAKKLHELGYRHMPGMYFPGWAATCWLKVLAIKVERLQQCSEEDAVLELVEPNPNPQPESLCLWRNYSVDVECYNCISARDSYYTMINAVDGPGTWAANPWVFAYTLQRVEKPAEAEKGAKR